MKVVVVGGAGYIITCSIVCIVIFEVTIFDNLSTGLKININKNAILLRALQLSSDLKKLFEKENMTD